MGEKLQPDMITLDGKRIGALAQQWEPKPAEVLAQETKETDGNVGVKASAMKKQKSRGIQSRDAIKSRIEAEIAGGAAERENEVVPSAGALTRFYKKERIRG